MSERRWSVPGCEEPPDGGLSDRVPDAVAHDRGDGVLHPGGDGRHAATTFRGERPARLLVEPDRDAEHDPADGRGERGGHCQTARDLREIRDCDGVDGSQVVANGLAVAHPDAGEAWRELEYVGA